MQEVEPSKQKTAHAGMIQPCLCQRSLFPYHTSQQRQKQFYEGKPLMMTNSGSHLRQQCLNGRYKWFLWTDRKENPKKKLGALLCGMKGLHLLHVVLLCLSASLCSGVFLFLIWDRNKTRLSVIVVCIHCVLVMSPFSWLFLGLPFGCPLCPSFHVLLGQMESNKQLTFCEPNVQHLLL